jgi:hypothetical protein
VTRKGSKLLGRGDREDVLLDVIAITYVGKPIHGDVRLGSDCYESVFKVVGRVDVTDFIDPQTGEVKIPVEFLTKNVVGFKQHVEKHFQERQIAKIDMGLRGDKYRVEWRKKRNKSKGFVRSALSKAINPEDK